MSEVGPGGTGPIGTSGVGSDRLDTSGVGSDLFDTPGVGLAEVGSVAGLDEVGSDPLALARQWLPGNDDPVRAQMTLATVGADGPSARTVLMSSVEPDGFTFHTDARSAKAADIAADPRVCLVVVWPDFFRQLVIHGVASRDTDDAITAAYTRRSPYLRHLAWLNDADFARLPLDERRARWATALAEHPDGPSEASETWVGYLVRPTRMLFWESATDTASRRTEYRLADDGWAVDHLPG